MLIDAVKGNKRDDAMKIIEEFKVNLDLVEDKIGRTGQRLHEKDRGWLGSKPSNVQDKIKRLRIETGGLSTKVMAVGADMSSSLGNVQNAWESFVTDFDNLWRDYQQHSKDLAEIQKQLFDIQKAFRDDCRGCP